MLPQRSYNAGPEDCRERLSDFSAEGKCGVCHTLLALTGALFLIIYNIRCHCPHFENEKHHAEAGNKSKHKEYDDAVSFYQEQQRIRRRRCEHTQGAKLFFTVFFYELCHKREQDKHWEICYNGTHRKQCRFFEVVEEQVVIERLRVLLRHQKQHGGKAKRYKRAV